MPVGGTWKISFVPYYMKSKMVWAAPRTDHAIEVLLKNGYDGVEWMLDKHFTNVRELETLVEKTRKKGLQVSNIMCWQDLVTTDDKVRSGRVKLLQNYLVSAGNLSIPVLNLFTGPMTWKPVHLKIGRDISEGRAWSLVVDCFSKLVESAEKNNVVVTVEAVFGMLVHDYYTMKELLGHFDSKNLGVNLDPSHLALYENDIPWAVSRLGQKIKHVHVKDAVGKPGTLGEDFVFPFLGEGVVQWREFFEALHSSNYSGYLSLEFENDVYLNNICDGDWAVAAEQSKARLEKFLQHV